MTRMAELSSVVATRLASDKEHTGSSISAATVYCLPQQAVVGADEADRTVARYLLCRLGDEAAGYAERTARRLAAAGRRDESAAWSAIAEAIADAQCLPGADELRLKAARCRRLANGIANATDPTRERLLDLAAEFDRKAVAALVTEDAMAGAPPLPR